MFAAVFPSHNDVIKLINCFKGLQQKIWFMKYSFFSITFIYIQVQLIVESFRKMAFLFDGQISNLS